MLPAAVAWPILAFFLVSSVRVIDTNTKQRSFPNRISVLEETLELQRREQPDDQRSLLRVSVPSSDSVLIWVDLENTRGKTGFTVDHWSLVDRIAHWAAAQHPVDASVVVVADHGSLPSAFYCRDRRLGLVFAGPGRKADDALVHGLQDFERQLQPHGHHHFVVTADGELKCRCRRAVKQPGVDLHIIDPLVFLEELQSAMETKLQNKEQDELQEGLVLSEEEQQQLRQVEAEIDLRAQIVEAQVQLDQKMSHKRRVKLQKTLRHWNSKLSGLPVSYLDRWTSTSQTAQQDRLWQRWNEIRCQSRRKEQTGDRVLLAEQLRRQFGQLSSVVGDDIGADENHNHSTAFSFIQCWQSDRNVKTTTIDEQVVHKTALATPLRTIDLLTDANNPVRLETLKIVAVSDTHGFENQFVDDLPAGDLLLHLGDFALEGSHQQAQKALAGFDTWLARQPQRYKIVVRGNHDPLQADFPRSGACYITEPTTLSFGDQLVLGVIPFGSSTNRKYTSQFPKACDILATHVPPHNSLDRTYTGKCVGSPFLRGAVRAMRGPPPRLWLCGHVHEGRGVAERVFGDTATTTVIVNVANANRGRATHLEHGATVVDIGNDRSARVQVVSMQDRAVVDRITSLAQFHPSGVGTSMEGVQELLLAVDLGLKSGVSLFNSDGRLLRYEQFLFDKQTLCETATNILDSWEREATLESLDADNEEKPTTSKITHLAIEGGENHLLRAWADAVATRDLCLLKVSPEEWRAELLLDKERVSGSDAKAASRLIARQVVMDFGVMEPHEGKFRTDVAESVCLGLYVARKIGWITRNLAVRRYSNGNVVVPKK